MDRDTNSIEDIILQNDRRGISALRPYLPPKFCDDAAHFVSENIGTAFIATGFYIKSADAPETDGPPGAVALGYALHRLGSHPVYVSDQYTVPVLRSIAGNGAEVVDFPITDAVESQRISRELLSKYKPSLLVSTERCGFTTDKLYRNMRGVDISPFTAKLDYLFHEHNRTVGIGDGGNEIGMGNVAPYVSQVETLPSDPAVTRTTHLIIASVSNWGCHGLVAALSRLHGYNLLPSVEEEAYRIRKAVECGAVDGISGLREAAVDGFTLDENLEVLQQLYQIL